MLDSIIEEVRYPGDFPDYPTKEEDELYDECLAKVKWLNSLKYRVQPKQEWSEEDKCMLNNVIDTLKPLSQTTHSGYSINSMLDWLKTLKERCAYKPTDEQIDAMRYVVSHYTPTVYDKLAWDALNTTQLLFEQLEKL